MDRQLRKQYVAKLKEQRINSFWYFSFIDNMETILQHGLLPKNEIARRGFLTRSFAEESVQDRRHQKDIIFTDNEPRSLHDVVPVYLCKKTPTLSARRDLQDELFFVRIRSSVLLAEQVEFAFTDGNAAASDSQHLVALDDLEKLPWEVLHADYWKDLPDSTRKRNSEFLIYPHILPEHFWELIVCTEIACARVQEIRRRNSCRITLKKQKKWFS